MSRRFEERKDFILEDYERTYSPTYMARILFHSRLDGDDVSFQDKLCIEEGSRLVKGVRLQIIADH